MVLGGPQGRSVPRSDQDPSIASLSFFVLLLEGLIPHKRSQHSHYFWPPDRDTFPHGVSPGCVPPVSTRCWADWPSLPPTCLQGMSEFEIPRIPEMARTLEVNYLGCTCFLPSNIFLLLRGESSTESKQIEQKLILLSFTITSTPTV